MERSLLGVYKEKTSEGVNKGILKALMDRGLIDEANVLRDLDTKLIEYSQNFVDDVDHSVKANTSLHLTEQKLGNRGFITGNIEQLINKKINVDFARPRIYSPFGMGIIDLLVAQSIYEEAQSEKNDLNVKIITDFFPQPYVT